MKKSLRYLLIALLGWLPATVSAQEDTNFFTSPQQRTETPNTILVQYKNDRVLANGNSQPRYDTVRVKNADRMNNKLKQLRKRSDVLVAAPNYTRDIVEINYNDPLEQYQLDLDVDSNILAKKAWSIKKGGKKVIIAVVDTGVDRNHLDLKDNMWTNNDETVNGIDDDGNGFVDDVNGWDFAENDNNPSPQAGCDTDAGAHGTHVSGIAAGRTNNSQGIAGIAWRSKIMAVKVSDNCDGSMTDQNVADAIVYAAQNGADVINLSLGGFGRSSVLQEAINTAKSYGATVVAAAGNNGLNLNFIPFFPVCAEGVIGVSATDQNDDAAGFSNFGSECVDIAAPGVDILSTIINDDYEEFSGTSMATPVISGVAALLKTQEADLTPSEILNILQDSAKDVGLSAEYGAGRVNAVDAMIALDSVKPVNIRAYKNDDKDKEYFSGETHNDASPYFEWQVPKLLNEDIDGYYVYIGKNEDANPVKDGKFKEKNKKNYTKDQKLKGGNNIKYYFKVAVKKTDGSIYSKKGKFTYILDTE